MSGKRFEYWRELIFMLFMIGTLALDITFFTDLYPFGDEGVRAGAATMDAQ